MARSRNADRLNAIEDAIEIRSCRAKQDRMMPWVASLQGLNEHEAEAVRNEIAAALFPPAGVSLDVWKRTRLKPLDDDDVVEGDRLWESFLAWEAEQGQAA